MAHSPTGPTIIIIGNKPFSSLALDPVIDSFDRNCRCNLGIPYKNNGTKFNLLYLCSHLYNTLVCRAVSKQVFINDPGYLPVYKKNHMDFFYDNWDKYAPPLVKLADNGRPNTLRFNQFLNKLGCPFTFSKLPRTGYVAIFDFLSKGYEVFVSHCSIIQEDRVSHYVKEGNYESDCHSKREELLILEWLHKNNHIDASLCLLEV